MMSPRQPHEVLLNLAWRVLLLIYEFPIIP